MTTPCIELVVYKVKDAAQAAKIRMSIMAVLKTFDGFVSWRALKGVEDAGLFVDYVEWASLAQAKAAGEAFPKDPRFKTFMETVDEVVVMGHFVSDGDIAA